MIHQARSSPSVVHRGYSSTWGEIIIPTYEIQVAIKVTTRAFICMRPEGKTLSLLQWNLPKKTLVYLRVKNINWTPNPFSSTWFGYDSANIIQMLENEIIWQYNDKSRKQEDINITMCRLLKKVLAIEAIWVSIEVSSHI